VSRKIDTKGKRMNAAERRRWDELQADRRVIGAGAAWLRTNAWEQSYAGFRDKDRAFALATLMDAISMQLDRVPPGLRAEAVRAAAWMVGGSSTLTAPRTPPR
jgi:hypothetical protein